MGQRTKKHDRNLVIRSASANGVDSATLARVFNISRQRVGQIIAEPAKMEVRANRLQTKDKRAIRLATLLASLKAGLLEML